MSEHFSRSLQEDLLTLMVHSDEHGRVISKLVDAFLFEGDYRVVAEVALDFWETHNKAPAQHIAELLSDIIEDPDNRRAQTFRRILIHMFEVKDGINSEYVLKSINDFNWLQRAKSITIKTAEQLQTGGIDVKEQFIDTWRAFLREGATQLNAGLRIWQIDRVLEYLAQAQREFSTGIKEFDEKNIVPMRGKLWLLIAPAKKGKTWALVQLGKHAFMARKKVLHISLEIEEEEVAQRYYQALFSVSVRDAQVELPMMDIEYIEKERKDGTVYEVPKILGFYKEEHDVDFHFGSNAIREELTAHLHNYGTRVDNLIIKRFPMSSLTFGQLEGYLESLEAIEGFVPDMVIIDYPKIMKLDVKDLRISLGQLMENLRGLSQRRNFALCAVHQTNRAGMEASFVKSTHASEDWSVVCTADFAITYSQTDSEKGLGLARLYVDAARSEVDKFGVVISQAYVIGQFALDSTKMSKAYTRLQENFDAKSDDSDKPDKRNEED